MKDLINNIDKIGVNPLLDAMTKVNSPDLQRFSELAYSSILKQKMDMVEEMVNIVYHKYED